MNWVQLTKIYGRSFRSLQEPFDVSFPESGMTLIRGLNKDTGDSSASGKSSLVLALSYLFGGCPFPRTELQSWGSEEPILVGGILQTSSGEVVVERGSSGLEVRIGGEVHKGKAAESVLDKVFGMDAKTRALTTYRGQGQDGLFLSMSDADKKEFLTETLGLEIYEKISADAQQKAKILKEQVTVLKGKLELAEENCKSLETPPDISALNSEMARLSKSLSDTNAAIAAATTEKNKIKVQVESEKEDVKARFIPRLNEVNEKISATLRMAPALGDLEFRLAEARSELKRLQAEEKKAVEDFHGIKAKLQSKIWDGTSAKKKAIELKSTLTLLKAKKVEILAAKCPTCKAPWLHGTENELEKINSEIESIKLQGKECLQKAALGGEASTILEGLLVSPTTTVDTGPVESKIRDIENQIKETRDSHKQILDSEIAKLREESKIINQEYNNELITTAAGGTESIAQIEKQIRSGEDLVSQISSDIGIIRFQISSAEKTFARNLQVKRIRDILSLEYSEVSAEMSAESDLSDLVGRTGFLGVIFDEILDEISAATNDILAKVANVRHLTFGFVSEKESASGNSQRRISPVVVCGGKIVDFRSGLSGGMQSAVKLAVDLAVGEVIAKRRGSYPGWLVLDESFDGLGRVSKESCLEMLGSYAGDRLVLVIDHATEFQGLFNQTIDIVSSDGKSSVSSLMC
jgi:DNA repair exonuclease SbcCD ATPase subunit